MILLHALPKYFRGSVNYYVSYSFARKTVATRLHFYSYDGHFLFSEWVLPQSKGIPSQSLITSWGTRRAIHASVRSDRWKFDSPRSSDLMSPSPCQWCVAFHSVTLSRSLSRTRHSRIRFLPVGKGKRREKKREIASPPPPPPPRGS